MNAHLKEVLQQLKASKARVRITLVHDGGAYPWVDNPTGTIVDFDDTKVWYRPKENTYKRMFYVREDHQERIEQIVSTTARRRKGEKFYPVYYEALPYVQDATGDLDLSATLSSLFARA